jgi:hypothetical protein
MRIHVDSPESEYELAVGSREQDNELSVSVKGEGILYQLSDH